MRVLRQTDRVTWGLFLALALTFALYQPGLRGGYLFDDYPNIVENVDVQVHNLDLSDWKLASQASPSAQLRRPLAMLSFAANIFFTGLAPWPMKLTNLLIHLLNGALLYLVLKLLLSLPSLKIDAGTVSWTTLGITTAWLVSPINVSGVLYVVQRMESLAQLCVLAGLWIYLLARRRMLEGRRGLLLASIGLISGVSVGFQSKESAILLPLYALILELTLLRFRTFGSKTSKQLLILYSIFVLLPTVIALSIYLPQFLSASTYLWRPFTLEQRLFTELRVLVGYASSTVFPNPQALGFYHDDIALSNGWLSPPTTLLSAIIIAGSILLAILYRLRMPLLSLGVGWYFTAHLLTATVIPLELVFEHRNYFASIGLLTAGAALLVELYKKSPLLGSALPLILIGMFGTVTLMRAVEWSNPIRFAYAEAQEHPNSPRASFELGRTLLIASEYRPESKLISQARQAFEHAASLPNSRTAPYAALILISAHLHTAQDSDLWTHLSQKLQVLPPSEEDVSALQSLYLCQYRGECPPQTQELLNAFQAALNHEFPRVRLIAYYGAFSANCLGDYTLATEMFSRAIALSPENIDYRIELASILKIKGDTAGSSKILDQVDNMEPNKAQILQIQNLRQH